MFFSLAVAPVHAVDHDSAGSVVVVAVTSAPDVATTVPSIIRTAIDVELRRYGILPVETDERTSPIPVSPEDLFSSAIGLDGDFFLHVFSSPEGDRVRLAFELFAMSDKQLVASSGSVESLDLTFDRAVAEMTRAIVDDIRALLAVAGSARRASQLERPPEQSRSVVSDDEFGPSAEAGTGGSGSTASAEPGLLIVSDEPPRETYRELVSLSVGFSPLAPMGPAATYYSFGYGATANVLVVLGPEEFFSVGGFVRAGTIAAQGAVADATLFVLPFGVTVRLSSRPAPAAPFLRLMGGTAFFRLDSERFGRLEKYIPYAGLD
ncbi:MAG: hypothetical protein EA426_11480, partial [Spirochaetaceae bacterium]